MTGRGYRVSFDQRMATPNNSNGSNGGWIGVPFDNSWVHKHINEESGGSKMRKFDHNVQGEKAGVSNPLTTGDKQPFLSISQGSYAPGQETNDALHTPGSREGLHSLFPIKLGTLLSWPDRGD